jgi:hypothetical protein
MIYAFALWLAAIFAWAYWPKDTFYRYLYAWRWRRLRRSIRSVQRSHHR